MDLGIKEKVPASPCGSPAESGDTKCEEKTYYPTLYVRSKEKLKFPDGEFTGIIRGKVVSRTERKERRDGSEPEESCSYDIEVYSLEPKGGDTKSEDVGQSLRKGAMKIMEKKKDEEY